jgi:hypothetical protein
VEGHQQSSESSSSGRRRHGIELGVAVAAIGVLVSAVGIWVQHGDAADDEVRTAPVPSTTPTDPSIEQTAPSETSAASTTPTADAPSAISEVIWGPKEMLIQQLTNVDLDTAPPTMGSYGEDSDFNWGLSSPPSVQGRWSGTAPWSEKTAPTGQECWEWVATHGQDLVQLRNVRFLCSKTSQGNIAVVEILRISNQTSVTMRAKVTVWRGLEPGS